MKRHQEYRTENIQRGRNQREEMKKNEVGKVIAMAEIKNLKRGTEQGVPAMRVRTTRKKREITD